MKTIALPLRRLPSVSFKHQWMAETPSLADAFGFTAYYNCRSRQPHRGFLRFPKLVLEVDLELGMEEILNACDESTRYKIRRAPREGVLSQLETDRDSFLEFYNAFASTKGLGDLDPRHLECYWPFMTVTKAICEDSNLAMHAYLVDHAASRATLLYSCSHFRNSGDSKHRNFLARASRFLYWSDMCRFSAIGLRWFDFGYFGDASQIGQVNEFKKGYPCFETPVSTYISFPFFLFRRVTQPKLPF